ncbi:DUF1499 domain-containing protein [Rubrobacter marinus]|uniref:DUF1499 domain-containing protein n=1 Tax=Rubrobacter marinus TaxID=2653852 RepID=UPI00140D11B9|nr:DUF1499 domain-containing protein [Rubrobacter marinus]
MDALGKTASYETSRTYPVAAKEVRRAVEAAVRGLPRWELGRSSEAEVTAVRRTRLGFRDDVSVGLSEGKTGAHTNTRAALRSVSRKGVYDFGQNKRNLRELLDGVDRELRGLPHS